MSTIVAKGTLLDLSLHSPLVTGLGAAHYPKLGLSALARALGPTAAKQPTLGQKKRGLTSRVINDQPGLDLLAVSFRQTSSDFRLRHVFLTERGHRLAERMVEVMKDHPRKRIYRIC
jgi:hypothetical protein